MRKKLTNILLLLLFIIILAVPTYAADESIDVFYTNDIHSYINNHAEDENARSPLPEQSDGRDHDARGACGDRGRSPRHEHYGAFG